MCNGLSVISLIIQAERAAITKNLQGEVITLFRPVRYRAIQINACLQRHSLSKLAPVARSYSQLRSVRFRKAVPTEKNLDGSQAAERAGRVGVTSLKTHL